MVYLLQNVKGKHAVPGSCVCVCVCSICPLIFEEDAPEVRGPSVLAHSLSPPQ